MLQPEDLYDLTAPGEPRLSPDGKWVCHVVAGLDRRRDAYRADLYVVSAAGGEARRLAQGVGRLRQPAWSPDGRRIAFIDQRTEAPQVWIVDVNGGEPRQITHDGAVTSFCWSPDGTRIASCALSRGVQPGVPKIREFHRVPTTADGLGPLEAQGPSLYLTDMDSGEARLVSGGPYTYDRPVWSPDGRYIACGRLEHFSIAAERGGSVWVVPVTAGEGRVVAPHLNWYGGTALAWSPDSRSLAYCSSDMHISGRVANIVRVGVDGGELANLNASHDRAACQAVPSDARPGAGAPGLAWSADGRWVYYVAGDGGTVPVFRCAADGSGRYEQVTPPGRECVAEFSLGPGERLTYLSITDTDPDQVVVLDTGATPRRITQVALEFWTRAPRVPMMRFAVRGRDGPEAEAWITRPAGATGPTPAILAIHGGPAIAFGYCLNFQRQLWVDSGWALIQVNPPGSQGYGFEFARSIWGDWCGRDFDYQMAAVDYCVDQRWVDPARVAITGISYGGYMANQMITRTDRFVCAVSEHSISNLYSLWGTAEFGLLLSRHYVGGFPWEQGDKYLAQSPVHNAVRVRTPILFIHAEGDRRCPIAQAEEYFTALTVLGKEAVLVRYPGDSHTMPQNGRPSHRVDRLVRTQAWFRRFLG